MGLETKLSLKQTQKLVMTAMLQQAIKSDVIINCDKNPTGWLLLAAAAAAGVTAGVVATGDDAPDQGDQPGDSPSGSNSASCMGQCGQTLGGCAHDVASGGASCIKDCKSASDRQACIRDCTATAKNGHGECKDEGRECRSDCGFSCSACL